MKPHKSRYKKKRSNTNINTGMKTMKEIQHFLTALLVVSIVIGGLFILNEFSVGDTGITGKATLGPYQLSEDGFELNVDGVTFERVGGDISGNPLWYPDDTTLPIEFELTTQDRFLVNADGSLTLYKRGVGVPEQHIPRNQFSSKDEWNQIPEGHTSNFDGSYSDTMGVEFEFDEGGSFEPVGPVVPLVVVVPLAPAEELEEESSGESIEAEEEDLGDPVPPPEPELSVEPAVPAEPAAVEEDGPNAVITGNIVTITQGDRTTQIPRHLVEGLTEEQLEKGEFREGIYIFHGVGYDGAFNPESGVFNYLITEGETTTQTFTMRGGTNVIFVKGSNKVNIGGQTVTFDDPEDAQSTINQLSLDVENVDAEGVTFGVGENAVHVADHGSTIERGFRSRGELDTGTRTQVEIDPSGKRIHTDAELLDGVARKESIVIQSSSITECEPYGGPPCNLMYVETQIDFGREDQKQRVIRNGHGNVVGYQNDIGDPGSGSFSDFDLDNTIYTSQDGKLTGNLNLEGQKALTEGRPIRKVHLVGGGSKCDASSNFACRAARDQTNIKSANAFFGKVGQGTFFSNLLIGPENRALAIAKWDRFFAGSIVSENYWASLICQAQYPDIQDSGFAMIETPSGSFQAVANIQAEKSSDVPLLCNLESESECPNNLECENDLCVDDSGSPVMGNLYSITWGVRAPADESYTPYIDEDGIAVSYNVVIKKEAQPDICETSTVGECVRMYSFNGDKTFPLKLENGESDGDVLTMWAPSSRGYDEVCIDWGNAPVTVNYQHFGTDNRPTKSEMAGSELESGGATLGPVCNTIETSTIATQIGPDQLSSNSGSSSSTSDGSSGGSSDTDEADLTTTEEDGLSLQDI